MKKFIKNYLAKLQENDKKGFSLVELIIVMAIMAILVGVVASQVLPYMEKSRQSKDQQILSGICTDVVSSIAQASQAVATFDTEVENLNSTSTDANLKLVGVTFEELRGGNVPSGGANGTLASSMKSKEAKEKGYAVKVKYDDATGKVTVYLDGSTSDKMKVESDS